MISPRWQKIIRDLWVNRISSFFIIVSIAIGIFAIGTIVGTNTILSEGMAQSFLAINPANAQIYTAEPFNQEMIDSIRNMDEIADAEGRYTLVVRFKTNENKWRNLQIFILPDYKDVRINQIKLKQGAWPPSKKEIVIEQNALGLIGGGIGKTLLIETPSGKQRELSVTGIGHEMSLYPAAFAGTAYGYITFETLEWLGIPYGFNELLIVTKNRFDREKARQASNRVQDRLEEAGITIRQIFMPLTPGRHDAQDIVEALTIILGVLGILVLLLGTFLVTNTVSGLLAQQIRYIGVMKTIGARTYQLVLMYLSMALIYGLIAIIPAVPISYYFAKHLSKFILFLVNFEVQSFDIPIYVYGLQIIIGIVVPICAAIYPVLSGTRITIRAAIQPQIGNQMNQSIVWLSQLLSMIPIVVRTKAPRSLLLSLHNTFRKPGRLVLTLLTLTLSSATVIAVLSVRSSMVLTFVEATQNWKFDVEVTLQHFYRLEKINQIALHVPGVIEVEEWGVYSTRQVRENGNEGSTLLMLAPPANTNMTKPVLVEGRWLNKNDENAIVIDVDLLKLKPNLKLGDELVLKVDHRELTWLIVGVVKSQFRSMPVTYVNYKYFSESVMRKIDKANHIVVMGEQHDLQFQTQVARDVEKELKRAGMKVNLTETVNEIRSRVKKQFDIVIVFLIIMGLMMSVVGGLGLASTMSLNVLDRTREIAIMRAIGASNRSIQEIVIVEGIIIGVLSWLFGAILAYPLSRFLSDAVGIAMANSPLTYSFSISGMFIWLGLVLLISSVATSLPAWNATRINAKDALDHN